MGCGWRKQGNSWGAGGSFHIWEPLNPVVIEAFHMVLPLSPVGLGPAPHPSSGHHLGRISANRLAFSKDDTGGQDAAPLVDQGQRFPLHSIQHGLGESSPVTSALQNNSGYSEIGTHAFCGNINCLIFLEGRSGDTSA